MCRNCCIWDWVQPLDRRARKKDRWAQKRAADAYRRRGATSQGRECVEPLLWSVSNEKRCCKSWCLLLGLRDVEDFSRTILPVDRRLQAIRTHQRERPLLCALQAVAGHLINSECVCVCLFVLGRDAPAAASKRAANSQRRHIEAFVHASRGCSITRDGEAAADSGTECRFSCSRTR